MDPGDRQPDERRLSTGHGPVSQTQPWVVALGPAALWSIVSTIAAGGGATSGGIEFGVFGLFYSSWFLWAIAGGAATPSYQVRTSGAALASPA
ncbi:MAG TPA: hypothetical protein VGK32_23585 [Vicinamibacterales bacterium]|jgi:hypothetical protein